MEIALLPLDLARWDQAPAADLCLAPVFSDVRPLRGVAGLVDWRLNGHLSDRLREERFTGERGERLLLPTRRLPWKAVLALGLGSTRDFDDSRFGEALDIAFSVGKGLGASTMAAGLPGRDTGKVDPERAATLLQKAAHERNHVTALTLLDSAAALKIMGELLGLSTAARARAAAKSAAGA
ncbi:MAG TPA: M17 family peptidase N-terminal domain-containing protein [Polyangia bacterium]|nr:M17 family peptidase N-terminal domain-containing protein [Polyangia bacterium]